VHNRFCSQIWARGGMQLRPWELDERLDEAKVSWGSGSDALSSRNSWNIHKRHHSSISELRDEAFTSSADLKLYPISSSTDKPSSAIIAPFEDPPLYENFPHVSTGDIRPLSRDAAMTIEREFPRPPVFGPEKAVLDPRIRALHKQIVFSMYHFGFWCTVVSQFHFLIP
jgi:hypothetical protein